MNIIILPYAGVPSYYFFIDQGQYLAQSLVVVKKKKRKNKTGTKRFCNRRTVVIFLHILKITSVILWHDRCVVIVCCALNDDNAHCHCVSVYMITLFHQHQRLKVRNLVISFIIYENYCITSPLGLLLNLMGLVFACFRGSVPSWVNFLLSCLETFFWWVKKFFSAVKFFFLVRQNYFLVG